MSGWWADLSRREQVLVMIAAVLAGVLAISLFVVKPVAQWRADAAQEASRARDSYEMVASAAAMAGQAIAPAPQDAVPIRQAITMAAQDAQIELIRIGSESSGQIETQPAPVDGERLFQWLGALETQYGVTVAFADISSGGDGVVNAQVLVFERAQ
jgi:type II secretory pathway component PulM